MVQAQSNTVFAISVAGTHFTKILEIFAPQNSTALHKYIYQEHLFFVAPE